MKFIVLVIFVLLLYTFRKQIYAALAKAMGKEPQGTQRVNSQPSENITEPQRPSITLSAQSDNQQEPGVRKLSEKGRKTLLEAIKVGENLTPDDIGEIGIGGQTRILGDLCERNGVDNSNGRGTIMDVMGMLYAITMESDETVTNYMNQLYDLVIGELKNKNSDILQTGKSLIVLISMQNGWDNQLSQDLYEQAVKSLASFIKTYPPDYDKYSHPAGKTWLLSSSTEIERNQWHCLTSYEIKNLINAFLKNIMKTSTDWFKNLTPYIPVDQDAMIDTLYDMITATVVLGSKILSFKNPIPDSQGFMLEMLGNVEAELKNELPAFFIENYDWSGHLTWVLEIEQKVVNEISDPNKIKDNPFTQHIQSMLETNAVITNSLLDDMVEENDETEDKESVLHNYYETITAFQNEMVNISKFYGLI